MAIATRPKKHQSDIAPLSNDEPALKFIEGADKTEPQPETPAHKPEPEKEPDAKPIIVRGIDAELMRRLDAEAKRRRVSRAAMVRMLLAEHLPE
jgi:hypothetical protein